MRQGQTREGSSISLTSLPPDCQHKINIILCWQSWLLKQKGRFWRTLICSHNTSWWISPWQFCQDQFSWISPWLSVRPKSLEYHSNYVVLPKSLEYHPDYFVWPISLEYYPDYSVRPKSLEYHPDYLPGPNLLNITLAILSYKPSKLMIGYSCWWGHNWLVQYLTCLFPFLHHRLVLAEICRVCVILWWSFLLVSNQPDNPTAKPLNLTLFNWSRAGLPHPWLPQADNLTSNKV